MIMNNKYNLEIELKSTAYFNDNKKNILFDGKIESGKENDYVSTLIKKV